MEQKKSSLTDKKGSARKTPLNILITCGPTREPIDPVRFISNYSTGTIGLCLAKEAIKKEYNVTLIAGPVGFTTLKGLRRFISVETALEMKKALDKYFKSSDIIFMAAAVSDFRPDRFLRYKLKRKSAKSTFYLKLVENPDILLGLSKKKKGKLLVGFALETDNFLKNATEKLKKKNLDLLVLNTINKKKLPFGDSLNSFFLIDRLGGIKKVGKINKQNFSRILLDKAESLWYTFYNIEGLSNRG